MTMRFSVQVGTYDLAFSLDLLCWGFGYSRYVGPEMYRVSCGPFHVFLHTECEDLT